MFTLNDALVASNNRPSGFDYLRLTLSILVVVSHSVLYCYGDPGAYEFWNSPARPILKFMVPMFFALSGFLVASSLERSPNVLHYLWLRGIRIFPALATLVLVTALIIGPLVTVMSLDTYLADEKLTRYLMGAVGHMGFTLPGVFNDLPFPSNVNSQLWTIPYELKAYIILGLLMLLGVSKRGWLVLVAAGLLLGRDLWTKLTSDGSFDAPMSTGGEFLIAFFMAGAFMYFYRHRIAFDSKLFIASAIASVVLLSYVKGGEYFAMLPVGYMTVFLGLLNPKRSFVSAMGDYSYAIYLWGAVIQQTVVFAFPDLREWYWNLLISIPICILVGWASWVLIERPALRLRRLPERSMIIRWMSKPTY